MAEGSELPVVTHVRVRDGLIVYNWQPPFPEGDIRSGKCCAMSRFYPLVNVLAKDYSSLAGFSSSLMK